MKKHFNNISVSNACSEDETGPGFFEEYQAGLKGRNVSFMDKMQKEAAGAVAQGQEVQGQEVVQGNQEAQGQQVQGNQEVQGQPVQGQKGQEAQGNQEGQETQGQTEGIGVLHQFLFHAIILMQLLKLITLIYYQTIKAIAATYFIMIVVEIKNSDRNQ